MSDKKQKSLQELEQEYYQLCAKAGQLQYQIFNFTKDLEMLNKEIRDLNLEAAAVKAAEVQAKVESQKAEQTPQPDPSPTQSGAV